MKDVILSVDIGTSSLKAAFFSSEDDNAFVSRQIFYSNHSFSWIPALKTAVAELNSVNPDTSIKAVCISGNGPTLVSGHAPSGRYFRPSLALIHRLFRKAPQPVNYGAPIAHAKETTFLYSEDISQLTLPETKSLFIPRLAAFKKLFPEVWESSKYIFSGPEYLIYALTGKALTILPERRYKTAYWSKKELKRCGFSKKDIKKLPRFKYAGSLAGEVTADAAAATGLLKGTSVYCGGPDFTVALIGSGTVQPGTLCDRAGSSEGINLCTSKPIFASGIRTLPSPVSTLWNASVLLGDTGTQRLKKAGKETDEEILKSFSQAINLLRTAAENAGEVFPLELTMTGGQCRDKEWIKEKEKASGLKIKTQNCYDSELIGDFILAKKALETMESMETSE